MDASQPLSQEVAELIAGRFSALGDPMRLRILDTLRLNGEASVGGLAEALDARHANVSKHLGVLYAAKIVARRKQATSVIYWISDPVVFEVCDRICGALRDDLDRLGALLEPAPLLAPTKENA
jgi:DNA-binding transcriptional ArsR family regulator